MLHKKKRKQETAIMMHFWAVRILINNGVTINQKELMSKS